MSNYTKATNFATKDALTSGNPLKTLSGTELDDEFNAIQTANATKANTASAQLTGIPVAPTAAADTNTTQLATTAFVTTEANLKADLAGAAFTGAITTTSTIDGVDIATRDGVLTTTTTTANAALPKAGGTMTGVIAGFESTGIDDNATSTAITIDASENVGIGTSSPSSFNSTGGKLVTVSGAGEVAALFSDATYYTLGVKHTGVGSEAVGMFGGTPGSALALMTNNAERMRIDSAGNVGIGTSSPDYQLDIEASSPTVRLNSTVTNGVNSLFFGHSADADAGAIKYWGSAAGLGSYANAMTFNTNGSQALHIDSSGTTSFHGISGRATGATGHMSISEQSNNRSYIELASTSTSSTTLVVFLNPNAVVGSITTSGSSTSYSTSSDYRLKEADVPMTGATERVKALRPINFAWKVDGKRVDGFYAHELQAVVPEAATGTKDAMRDEEYEVTPAVVDAEGVETTAAVMGTRSVPDMQGIDQSKLVPLLTATIQELIARIEALEQGV